MPEAARSVVTTERIAEALGGRRVLRRSAASPEGLHAQLRAGLPYAALEAIASSLELAREDLTAVLHLPPRTLARRKREKRLRPDESDRLFRLGRIAALAEDALGSREKASRWLHTPNRALGQAVPLRHLDTDLGARQVEDLLVRIAHGIVS